MSQINVTSNKPSKLELLSSVGMQLLLVVALLLASKAAFAAGANLTGGLNQANTWITNAKNILITIVGSVAIIYLLWKAVDCWRGRADWGEFGMAIVYVAVAGGATALATWAYGIFAA